MEKNETHEEQIERRDGTLNRYKNGVKIDYQEVGDGGNMEEKTPTQRLIDSVLPPVDTGI